MQEYDKELYNNDFYEKNLKSSSQSAVALADMISKILAPSSIVDIGCSSGAMLKQFKDKMHVSKILGIDGPWIKKEMLQIQFNDFLVHDLTKPLKLDSKFDLVVSLEVGEHLDQKYADVFVTNLVSLGDVILFSAAIPKQGGRHHVNEQWPDYWAKLFKSKGFVAIDCARPYLWDKDLAFYYAQNSIFYCRESSLKNYPKLYKFYDGTNIYPRRLVHPMLYEIKTDPTKTTLSFILKSIKYLPYRFVRKVKTHKT